MEDQGKRLIIAVVLCMAILWLGSTVFGPKPAPPTGPVPTPTGDAGTSVTAAAPLAVPATQPTTPVAAANRPLGPEQRITLTTPRYVATFSSFGGGLASWQLIGSQYRTHTAAGVEVPMDLVPAGDKAAWYPLQVTLPDSTFAVDSTAEWTLEKKSDSEIVARWASADVEIVKSFRVRPDTYALELGIQVTNRSTKEAEERLAVSVFGFQDPSAPTERKMFAYAPPPWEAACYVGGEAHRDSAKALASGPKQRAGDDLSWAGVEHKYFLFAVAPKPAVGETYGCVARAVTEQPGVFETTLVFPGWKLRPGDAAVRTMMIYAGPKLLEQLEEVSRAQGADTHLTAAVDWGPAPMRWFVFLARPMLSLLKVFHRWVGNWGVAIILLTIAVKLLTLYWTTKSMRSMKAMSKLKPKLDEIRTKWPEDKQRQNVEMMNLYKVHDINPLGGCLPMLLQMPVWMALYSTLGAAADLYQAPFAGWIHDLTAPDRYYVLPIAVTALMFLQSKLSPPAVDSAQQKMMMYMMPAMFGVFSLVFPAGLSLYIFTNTLLGMAHQLYMNKTDDRPRAAKA